MSKVSQLLFFVWTSASFSISLSLDERMDGDGRTDGGHKKKTRLKKKGKKIIIIKEKRCTPIPAKSAPHKKNLLCRRLSVASKRATSLKVRGVLLRFAALVGKSGVRIRLKGLKVLDS